MKKEEKISELEEKISFHRTQYYEDQAEIPDAVYDSLEEELEFIDPKNKLLETTGSSSKKSSWTQATHKMKMFSLSKLKDHHDHHDLIKKINTDCFVEEHKLDGISIELVYEKGKLIEAITRGDGITGELITKNVLKMKNVKSEVNSNENFSVRGEIILKEDDFEKVNVLRLQIGKAEMVNLRNGAGGISKRLDGLHSEYCTILFYDLYFHDGGRLFPTEIDKLKYMEFLGFTLAPYQVVGVEDIDKVYKDELTKRISLDYAIDGLVFKMNDLMEAHIIDEENKVPKTQMAWKFPASRIECQLVKVVWSLEQGDKITPVACVKPLFIILPDGTKKPIFSVKDVQKWMGAKISNVMLNNPEWIKEKGLGLMDIVIVERANDVIPILVDVVKSKGIPIPIPTECPQCGSQTVIRGRYLHCDDPLCPAKTLDVLLCWINVMKVKDFGYETVYKLQELKRINEPADFYKIKEEDISTIEGLGDISATKILNQFKNRKISLQCFLQGLAIDNVGSKTVEKIIAGGFDTIDKLLTITISDLIAIADIGEKTAEKFIEGLQIRKTMIVNLLSVITIHEEKQLSSTVLSGQSFCITGSLTKKRPEIELLIKQNGGKVGSVSKKLDFLIVGNEPGSKYDKAKELGIPCISEEEFYSKLDAN